MNKADMLQLLSEEVSGCKRCQYLASSRIQTVFGRGNPEAKVVICAEAPGANEDQQGLPFVGRAGELLNGILAECGIDQNDVYICNILKCRPLGNAYPKPDEAANCRAFLDLQLEIIAPDFIVCMGAAAANYLLEMDEPITKIRGKWWYYRSSQVICTFHPAYILRQPEKKKYVLDDMHSLLREMKK